CTAASFAAGASVVLTLVVHVPATSDGTTFDDTAGVSSDFDPNDENDGGFTRLCVQADNCAAGACNNNHQVVCPTAGPCQLQGTCDSATGLCAANPPKPNATPCNDGNACTQLDLCLNGVCTATFTVVCPVADPCHDQSVCDTATGTCPANPVKPDAT